MHITRFWDNCPWGKLSPDPKTNPNFNPNPNPNRGAIFRMGNCPDTILPNISIS